MEKKEKTADEDHNPQPRPRRLVGDLLKWLGAISRFLNNYKILIAMESSLETKCFAFETCTQALSDMCITTILFKWQQAVAQLIEYVTPIPKPITTKITTF